MSKDVYHMNAIFSYYKLLKGLINGMFNFGERVGKIDINNQTKD